MRARYLLIVNPHSANRSTGRLWPKMEERLRPMLAPFDAILTEAPGDATRLAREAAGRYESIVAVGGDGTVGEVVNGLIDEDGAARPGVALGVIPRGTGNDLVRSLRLPTSLKAAAAV
ncbi:MAG: acylglycerol kinase family protein, partial [Dehalococcoidia bacterium]